jgi:hypothetical protein
VTYNVTQQVLVGYADHATFLRRSSLIPGEYFQFTALPTVDSLSTNTGNIGGQKLSITGSGFSLNKKDNSVFVDANPCDISYSDKGNIQCTVAPKNETLSKKLFSTFANQTKGYSSGAGLNYARYEYSSTITNFVNAVRKGARHSLETVFRT